MRQSPLVLRVQTERNTQLLATIARDALRAAVMASTDKAALDVAGDALRAIADLSRAEVSHVV